MRNLTLAVLILLSVQSFAKSLNGKPRILLPKGAVWVERGLHATVGIGQNRQWEGGEFLFVNEGGGYAYTPTITGQLTVLLLGGLYYQEKYVSANDVINEKRIFVSEKYGMNVKFHFPSDNKKRVLYLSPMVELDQASNSSLERSVEVTALTDTTTGSSSYGKLIDKNGDVIEREFVESKAWMVGFEIGYGERYRNYWGFSASINGKCNPFRVDYRNLVGFEEEGTGVPVWESSGTVGISIDLIEIWPGMSESLNAMFLYGDTKVTYDSTLLNVMIYFGSTLAF